MSGSVPKVEALMSAAAAQSPAASISKASFVNTTTPESKGSTSATVLVKVFSLTKAAKDDGKGKGGLVTIGSLPITTLRFQGQAVSSTTFPRVHLT